MAAQPSKDHANLVAAAAEEEDEDEDEDKAEISTATEDKALTMMTNLSLAEEDYNWAFYVLFFYELIRVLYPR